MKLWKYLKEKMTKNPTQTVRQGAASISYEELWIFAESAGQRLSDTHYGVLCSSELTTLMALLACIYAERPAILLPMRRGIEPCSLLVERFGPPYIIHDTSGEIKALRMDTQEGSALCPQGASVILWDIGKAKEPTTLSEENMISAIEKDASDNAPHASLTQSTSFLTSSSSLVSLLCALSQGRKIIFDIQDERLSQ